MDSRPAVQFYVPSCITTLLQSKRVQLAPFLQTMHMVAMKIDMSATCLWSLPAPEFARVMKAQGQVCVCVCIHVYVYVYV